MAYIFDLVDTWASGGGPYTSIKMNATDNDTGSASLLMDLQVGGSSKFSVSKAGTTTFSGNLQISNNGVYLEGTTVGTVRVPGVGGYYGWTTNTSSTSASTIDLILTRRAAANLRFGAADAAAPVAQTLSVQSVVAGTTNTAGTALTITGSQGTGTGAGGSIIFQVAPAGSSGSAQNALATALTINSSSQAVIGSAGTAAAPTLVWSADTTTGFYKSTGNILDFSAGGVQAIRFSSNGLFFVTSVGKMVVSSGGEFAFSSGTAGAAGIDVLLARDAANTLALRNGTAAQTFRVYNTYTSDTNYESGRLQWTGNEWRIGPETVGGSIRSMGLYSGSTRYQIIGSNFNQFDQPLYMNGSNIVTDTSTGFKIGTGATQKLGFWNATPIAQPTTAVAAATVAATGVGDVVAASTTFDGYTIPQIVKAMRNAGLLA